MSPVEGPERLTAAEAARRIAAGTLTSTELVRACLARIEARDPVVRAWCCIDAAKVLAEARECDQRAKDDPKTLPPLHGVPFGVKDVIDTVDLPTEHNSPQRRGNRPGADAAAVSMLRSAGAIVLGKTDTIEYAAGGRDPLTRNPHDPTRTPGGSSSGSGAAVGDFHVPLALGTQTGGSMIRPASFCGAFAMKPTHGVVSTEGMKRYAGTLDTIGWYARSIEDIALVASVYEISDEPIPAAPPLQGLRIGLCRTPYWSRALPATHDALAAAGQRLTAAGATVREVELAGMEGLNAVRETIMYGEGRPSFLDLYHRYGEALHPGILARIKGKQRVRHQDLRAALDQAAAWRVAFDRMFDDYDALITPSATGEAPQSFANTGDSIFNSLWTVLHAPVLSVPGKPGPAGLPVGISLIGPRYGDGKLLAVATATASTIGQG